MSNYNKFYRNGFACYTLFDEDKDTYFMYVGFDKEHPYYGSIFKTILHQPLYHYKLSLDRSDLKNKWWMGFSMQSTYEKAFNIFKNVVDALPK